MQNITESVNIVNSIDAQTDVFETADSFLSAVSMGEWAECCYEMT